MVDPLSRSGIRPILFWRLFVRIESDEMFAAGCLSFRVAEANHTMFRISEISAPFEDVGSGLSDEGNGIGRIVEFLRGADSRLREAPQVMPEAELSHS